MSLAESEKGRACEIWALAGGKGGTGKSFLTSSLGLYLAGTGRKVVLLDADLGGANLHTFLGISKPRNTLSDFYQDRLPLKDLVMKTGTENLGLVMGDINTLDTDNIKHTQKLKLFRHIKSLDVDNVIIDLGAGTHNNTLDTFLLAEKMIAVVTPEITSIENLYRFLNSAVFRKLKNALAADGLKDIIMDAWKNRTAHGIRNLRGLIEYLKGVSPKVGEIVEAELGQFKVHIVLNRARSVEDANLGAAVKSVCIKHLGLDTLYSGFIKYDENVLSCLNTMKPFLASYPDSSCAKDIMSFCSRVVQGGQAAPEEWRS